MQKTGKGADELGAAPQTGFRLEMESCEHCGGAVKIVASIEEPQVIARILQHLGLNGNEARRHPLHPARAPPIGSSGLFD